MLIREWLRTWTILWALIGLMSAGAYLVLSQLGQTEPREVARLRQAAQRVNQLNAEIQAMQQQRDQVHSRESLAAKLETSVEPYLLLAVVSRSAARTEGRVRVESFHYRQAVVLPAAPVATPLPGGPKVPPPIPEAVSSLTLQGIATDDLTVAEFVSALRDTLVFAEVKLESSLEDGPVRRYELTCFYR